MSLRNLLVSKHEVKQSYAGAMLKALRIIQKQFSNDENISSLTKRFTEIAYAPFHTVNLNLVIPEKLLSLYNGSSVEKLDQNQLIKCVQEVVAHFENAEDTPDVAGLPLEIWSKIFTFAKAQDLLNYMRVKRNWYVLIRSTPETAKILFERAFGTNPLLHKGSIVKQIRQVKFNITEGFCVKIVRSSILLEELTTNADCFAINDRLFKIDPIFRKCIQWNLTQTSPVGVTLSFDSTQLGEDSLSFIQLLNENTILGIKPNGAVLLVNLLRPGHSKILFSLQNSAVKCVHVDEEKIAIVYTDGCCEIRELISGKEILKLPLTKEVNVVHLKGSRLILGTTKGVVQIWDISPHVNEKSRCLLGYNVFVTPISHLAIQGNILAVCSNNKNIKIMEIHSVKNLKRIETSFVKSISFNGMCLRVVISEMYTTLTVIDYDFSSNDAEFFSALKEHPSNTLLPLRRFLQLPEEDKIAILALYKKDQNITSTLEKGYDCIKDPKALVDAANKYYKPNK